MASSTATLLIALIYIPAIVRAQERAPHGVAYESPLAISPEAYAFFHPETQHKSNNSNSVDTTRESLCDRSESDCSPFPTTASVQSDLAHESTAAPSGGRHGFGAGRVAGIPIGMAFIVILALGAFLVFSRKKNSSKAHAAIPRPEV